MLKRIGILAFAVLALIGCLFMYRFFFIAPPDTEENIYQITTLPLYVNNEVYIGTKPLLQNEDTYFIPYDIYGEDSFTADTDTPEFAVDINGFFYIDLDVLENDLGWHMYWQGDAIYIDNFPFDYSWTRYSYIAHAMGGIDGTSYTNSLEAFLENYENGHRVFEVDLSLTSDQKLVAIHDWSPESTIGICEFPLTEEQLGVALSQEEFKALKIKDKYTPLSFEDIVQLLKDYPDIYIVTDTKETEEPNISAQFQYIAEAASKVDPALLDRIIPQIYNEGMYYSIMDIHNWKSIIYTLYNQGAEYSPRSIISFTRCNGIHVVTTNQSLAEDLLLDGLWNNNCLIYMHTYNTLEEVQVLKSVGIYGFYTDFLIP